VYVRKESQDVLKRFEVSWKLGEGAIIGSKQLELSETDGTKMLAIV
jgi:hypothetical protein